MRTRYLLAALAAGLASTAATAQTTTGTGTTTTTTSGTNTTGLGGNSTGSSDFQIQGMQAAPQITGGTTAGANVQGSNAFAGYYANPYYQGRAGSTGMDGPGGFGTALSGTSSVGTNRTGSTLSSASRTGTTYGTATSGTGRTGTTSAISTGLGTTGTTGRTGTTGLGTTGFGTTGVGSTGFGATGRTGTTGLGTTGRTGTTGFGATGTSGTIIPLSRAITYTATMRMPVPAVQAAPMHTELRGVIDRSSMIANPKGIEILTNGPVVVLRGKVKDEDEAKTAEGIVRLTPGVKDVQNELKY